MKKEELKKVIEESIKEVIVSDRYSFSELSDRDKKSLEKIYPLLMKNMKLIEKMSSMAKALESNLEKTKKHWHVLDSNIGWDGMDLITLGLSYRDVIVDIKGLERSYRKELAELEEVLEK